jgi:hypothetical protein
MTRQTILAGISDRMGALFAGAAQKGKKTVTHYHT